MTDKRSDPGPADVAGENGSGERGSDPAGPEAGAVAKDTGADMQAMIGRQLRAVYDDIAKQPVPDRFLELMRQLDDQTS